MTAIVRLNVTPVFVSVTKDRRMYVMFVLFLHSPFARRRYCTWAPLRCTLFSCCCCCCCPSFVCLFIYRLNEPYCCRRVGQPPDSLCTCVLCRKMENMSQIEGVAQMTHCKNSVCVCVFLKILNMGWVVKVIDYFVIFAF